MIQGLDALDSLMADYYEMCRELGNNDDQYQRCNLTSERAIIEKELKEYQQHEEILNDYGLTLANFREACLLLAMLKGEGRNIHDINKQLKTLEIIKEKEVSLMRLRITKNYEHYNLICINERKLSEEEYDLLKEVLK